MTSKEMVVEIIERLPENLVGRLLAVRGWVLSDAQLGINSRVPLPARGIRTSIFDEQDPRPALYTLFTISDERGRAAPRVFRQSWRPRKNWGMGDAVWYGRCAFSSPPTVGFAGAISCRNRARAHAGQ